jgi:hypothetical protein
VPDYLLGHEEGAAIAIQHRRLLPLPLLCSSSSGTICTFEPAGPASRKAARRG